MDDEIIGGLYKRLVALEGECLNLLRYMKGLVDGEIEAEDFTISLDPPTWEYTPKESDADLPENVSQMPTLVGDSEEGGETP